MKTRNHLFRSSVALAAVCALVPVSTASASTPEPSQAEPKSSPSALAQSVQSNGDLEKVTDATAEVMALDYSTSTGLAALTVRIHNNGTKNIHANNFSNTLYDYRHTHLSGVTLGAGQDSRHHPLIDAEQNCTCSGYVSQFPYDPLIDPNQSVDYWVLYSLPEKPETVTVEIPGFDPIEDVPVG